MQQIRYLLVGVAMTGCGQEYDQHHIGDQEEQSALCETAKHYYI